MEKINNIALNKINIGYPTISHEQKKSISYPPFKEILNNENPKTKSKEDEDKGKTNSEDDKKETKLKRGEENSCSINPYIQSTDESCKFYSTFSSNKEVAQPKEVPTLFTELLNKLCSNLQLAKSIDGKIALKLDLKIDKLKGTSVQLLSDNGKLKISFITKSSSEKAILLSSISELETRLLNKNIQLTSIEIKEEAFDNSNFTNNEFRGNTSPEIESKEVKYEISHHVKGGSLIKQDTNQFEIVI